MTDFDTAARQEAERRYPAATRTPGTTDAFREGARWGASPLSMASLRGTFVRAERAEAALTEVAALADERGRWLESDDALAILARAEHKEEA